MRRQWISLLTGVMTAAALVGCGASDSVQTSGTAGTATAVSTETTQGAETSVTGDTRTADTAEGVSTQSEETASSGSRILVLYFDQGENSEGAGDTEVDAITSASLYRGIPDGIDQNDVLAMKNEIVSRTGADEYAVRINEKYAPAYEDMVDQAADDQDDDKQFTFESDLPDLSAYDTIFVGEPVWWGGMPQPMVNVFEQLDFSGKTIIPFGIHLGSGFGRILSQMEAMEPDAVVSDDGLTINGHTTAGGTQNWTSFGRQNDAALVGKMIVSPEVIVEAAGPLGDAPSRPIKAFYNLCGYDPSETPYAGKTGIMSD